MEWVKRKAVTTIYGLVPYNENLADSGLQTLKERIVDICHNYFKVLYNPKLQNLRWLIYVKVGL